MTAAGFLGARWWVFDLLGSLRVQVAAGLAVAAVLCAASRRGGLVAVCLAALAANAAVLAPLYVGQRPAPEPGGPRLRVASFNGGVGEMDVGALVDYLHGAPADVVFVLESRDEWDRAVRAAGTGYEVVHPPAGEPNRQTTVLSRVPLRSLSERRVGPRDEPRAVEVEVEVEGSRVSVLALHTLAPLSGEWSAIRDAELAAAGRWAAEQEGPAIVVGDLNATSWSHAFDPLVEPAGLLDSQRGFGLQPSWCSCRSEHRGRLGPLPLEVPIDHLVHSPDLTTVNRELGPSFGSDHRLLLVTLAPAAVAR